MSLTHNPPPSSPVIEEEEEETSERRIGGSNVDRGIVVGVWLALCDLDRNGNVNGDCGL